jgi:hypothetical protein
MPSNGAANFASGFRVSHFVSSSASFPFGITANNNMLVGPVAEPATESRFVVKASTNDGSTDGLCIQDSNNNEVMAVDSDGRITAEGSNHVPVSAGTTGGSGSAGAGNQYVELSINGTVYKVLHDGTV